MESGIQRLVVEGLIENRGEPDKDSFFILDGGKKDTRVTVINKEGKEVDTSVKYTTYDEFLALRARVQILMKAYEGTHAAKGMSNSNLKEEIQLLRKENESLRNELRLMGLHILLAIERHIKQNCLFSWLWRMLISKYFTSFRRASFSTPLI